MIRPEHLNHHGSLYAGRAADWMMETTFFAACLAHGDKEGLMYRNTHEFSFTKPILNGDIVRVESTIVRVGKKSLTMYCGFVNEETGLTHAVGYTTFVTINPKTLKSEEHSIVLDETDDKEELSWREHANTFFEGIEK